MPTEVPTRQRLLDSAVRTVEAHGEVALRVRDVARDAGVAYTSVYHFFGSREGLLQAALVERYRRDLFVGFDDFRAKIALCASRDQFRALLADGLGGHFNHGRSQFRLARANAIGSSLDRPELGARFAALHDDFNVELASILVAPQQRGWIRPGLDLRMAAAWYRGLVSSRVHIELDGPRPEHVFWDRYSTEAILAVVMGVAPDPHS